MCLCTLGSSSEKPGLGPESRILAVTTSTPSRPRILEVKNKAVKQNKKTQTHPKPVKSQPKAQLHQWFHLVFPFFYQSVNQ